MGLFDKLFGSARTTQPSSASREPIPRGGRAEFISPTDGSIVRSEHTAWKIDTQPHRSAPASAPIGDRSGRPKTGA